jgi:serine phosphatase RsbU (regulator of sigma subunit)
MKMKADLLIYFLFISNLLQAVQNQDDFFKTILLSPDNESFSINKSIYYFEDKKSQLSFEEIGKPEFASNFIPSTKKNLNFGYTHSTYWVKFHLQNLHPQINDWLFEIDYELLDSIDFFYLDQENKWKSKPFGDMYPFEQREWDYRTFIIPLELPDTSTKTYYVRFKTMGTMQFPMNISREKSFLRILLLSETYYGIFFGIMFLLIIYNTFVYFSLKDISYFHYIILIISTTILVAFLSGYVFQYVLKNSMWLNNKLLPSSIALSEFCIISFTRSFLNPKKYYPKLDKVLIYFLIGSSILIFLPFFTNYHFIVQVSAYTAQLCILVSLLSGILCLIKGNKAALLFILAFTLFLIGALAVSYIAIGLIGENPITAHGMELGVMLNGVFLSLALINNYKISKIEKEKAQKEIIQMRQKATEILEQKVKERTTEIQDKNEELNQQKIEITDSIHYASRIQSALLPPDEDMDRLLPSYFILNKPRDIVSGDYYWVSHKDNKVIVAVADCTGHGVPGAFMSILGIAVLNEIINKAEIIIANEILNELREHLIKSLHQTGSKDETRDGMEMALCVVDFGNKKLQYSGAFRPLYIIRNQELKEFKGDFMPIGVHDDEKNSFSNKELHFKEDDIIYLFSDGYVGQIGGPDRKTFRSRKFKQLLTDIHQKPLHEQKAILEKEYEKWRRNIEQIDDIMVMGIRFTKV